MFTEGCVSPIEKVLGSCVSSIDYWGASVWTPWVSLRYLGKPSRLVRGRLCDPHKVGLDVCEPNVFFFLRCLCESHENELGFLRLSPDLWGALKMSVWIPVEGVGISLWVSWFVIVICLNPKESVGCLGMCQPMFCVGCLGTMFLNIVPKHPTQNMGWIRVILKSITYVSELDNSISSSASRILMCDAYLGSMTTERAMSYEPSDILSGYLCKPNC